MGDVKEKARYLRKNLTCAEIKLWGEIRHKRVNGFKFRKQAPIGWFIVDFVCFEKKLIIELDGSQHLKNQEYDIRRTDWLNKQGFKVIRFWDDEVLNRTEAVTHIIYKELEKSPPSQPSPVKGEEEGIKR